MANDTTLASQCQNGTLSDDPNLTIKSWIAVMAYILSDPRMVQE